MVKFDIWARSQSWSNAACAHCRSARGVAETTAVVGGCGEDPPMPPCAPGQDRGPFALDLVGGERLDTAPQFCGLKHDHERFRKKPRWQSRLDFGMTRHTRLYVCSTGSAALVCPAFWPDHDRARGPPSLALVQAVSCHASQKCAWWANRVPRAGAARSRSFR